MFRRKLHCIANSSFTLRDDDDRPLPDYVRHESSQFGVDVFGRQSGLLRDGVMICSFQPIRYLGDALLVDLLRPGERGRALGFGFRRFFGIRLCERKASYFGSSIFTSLRRDRN